MHKFDLTSPIHSRLMETIVLAYTFLKILTTRLSLDQNNG